MADGLRGIGLEGATALLRERMRELDALYAISRDLSEPGESFERRLQRVVCRLPEAMQHAEHASARIVVADRVVETSDCRETPWALRASIRLIGMEVGRIDVFYECELPPEDQGPFLQEERVLLDEVARRIALALEVEEARSTTRGRDESLHRLVDDMPILIAGFDENGRTVVWNRAAEECTGYRISDVANRARLRQVLDPRPVARQDGDSFDQGPKGEVEVSITTRQGAECALSWYDFADQSPVAGIGSWIVAVDGARRERAERSLVESEHRFATLGNCVPLPIVVSTREGEILFANVRGRELVGVTPGETLSDRNIVDYYKDPRDRLKVLRRLEAEGRVDDCEVTLRRADGAAFPALLTAEKIRYDDVDAIFSVVQDISARKATERALVQAQKMEAIGRLTGGVAHDFNNLLMVIYGNAELLSESLEDRQELKRLADLVFRSAERGAELVERLLAFAQRQSLDPEIMDVNAIVGGLGVLLRRTLGEDIELHLDLGTAACTAMADPVQLETALLNLAVNARDAMPQGGTLWIQTETVEFDGAEAVFHGDLEPGSYVRINVTDTGVGIPGHHVQQIFEPFFTTKDVGKGSGLGLSMVYGFVKQSGGAVTVCSEPGQGTVFRLLLPRCERVSSSGASVPGDPAFGTALPTGSETILVVEDDPEVQEFVSRQLTHLGYGVIEARDGASAIACVESGAEPELLFTDVVLPGGMHGGELAEALRAHLPSLKVLFTSGYGDALMERDGWLFERDSLLAKPYPLKLLAERVRQILDREERAWP